MKTGKQKSEKGLVKNPQQKKKNKKTKKKHNFFFHFYCILESLGTLISTNESFEIKKLLKFYFVEK